MEAARRFVVKYWTERLNEKGGAIRDSKTALQEWAHSFNGSSPVYTTARQSGPDHDPTFVIKVEIEGIPGATGKGRSKRSAQQAAAEAVLLREAVWIRAADGSIKENPS